MEIWLRVHRVFLSISFVDGCKVRKADARGGERLFFAPRSWNNGDICSTSKGQRQLTCRRGHTDTMTVISIMRVIR